MLNRLPDLSFFCLARSGHGRFEQSDGARSSVYFCFNTQRYGKFIADVANHRPGKGGYGNENPEEIIDEMIVQINVKSLLYIWNNTR